MFPDLMRDDVFRLETRRLWLRWPRQGDAPAIAALAGEREIAEMTTRIPCPYPPDAADAFVLEARRATTEGRALALAVARKAAPHRLVGMVGLEPAAGGALDLGYWIGRPFQGQGLATEAARAAIDAAFAFAGAPAILARARTINPASRRVLEKCGFSHEGPGFSDSPLRGRMTVDLFRLERRAWASLKAWSREGYAPPAPAEEEGEADAAARVRPGAAARPPPPAGAAPEARPPAAV